ncbi:hypothetical protein [Prochlorococcus sp. MIT 1223]|uniref:hypothetical protein n=1 Tax=Prochlorococcus sp. MIT 1223 TaxID=3096217 RepID=UPI002A747675|nr:hypothetical protein [Prochlorococcus sp. MIT 1223]
MTSATATKPASKKILMHRHQSLYASMQSRFASAKLIQNLGSSNEGVQFNFVSKLRNAYGRD